MVFCGSPICCQRWRESLGCFAGLIEEMNVWQLVNGYSVSADVSPFKRACSVWQMHYDADITIVMARGTRDKRGCGHYWLAYGCLQGFRGQLVIVDVKVFNWIHEHYFGGRECFHAMENFFKVWVFMTTIMWAHRILCFRNFLKVFECSRLPLCGCANTSMPQKYFQGFWVFPTLLYGMQATSMLYKYFRFLSVHNHHYMGVLKLLWLKNILRFLSIHNHHYLGAGTLLCFIYFAKVYECLWSLICGYTNTSMLSLTR